MSTCLSYYKRMQKRYDKQTMAPHFIYCIYQHAVARVALMGIAGKYHTFIELLHLYDKCT